MQARSVRSKASCPAAIRQINKSKTLKREAAHDRAASRLMIMIAGYFSTDVASAMVFS